MVTDKKGEQALEDLETWANRIVSGAGDEAEVSVYWDEDSSTYVLRLGKNNRILLFRLSEAQIGNPGREQECERTLKRKLKDLAKLL